MDKIIILREGVLGVPVHAGVLQSRRESIPPGDYHITETNDRYLLRRVGGDRTPYVVKLETLKTGKALGFLRVFRAERQQKTQNDIISEMLETGQGDKVAKCERESSRLPSRSEAAPWSNSGTLTEFFPGSMITVQGAYGRDYKGAKAALKDWEENKDFSMMNRNGYINKQDADELGVPGGQIEIRYDRQRKVTYVKVAKTNDNI